MSKPRHKNSSQPGNDKSSVKVSTGKVSKTPRRARAPHAQNSGAEFSENRTLDLTEKVSQARKASRRTPSNKNASKSRAGKTAKVTKAPRSFADKLKFFGLCAGFGAVTIALLTFTAISYADYGLFQSQVEAKEARLKALQAQLATGEKRLQALQHPKGREQLLNERGYVRPGERLLLFPETPEEKRQAAFVTNDLTPHLPETLVQDGETGSSAWRRVANTLSGWWNNLRRASDAPTSLPIPPSEQKAEKKKEIAADVSTRNKASIQDAPSASASDFSVEN